MSDVSARANEVLPENGLTEVKSKILDQIKKELAQDAHAKVMSFDKDSLADPDLPDLAAEYHGKYGSSPF